MPVARPYGREESVLAIDRGNSGYGPGLATTIAHARHGVAVSRLLQRDQLEVAV